MKHILLILCVSILFACNNEGSDTTADDTTSSLQPDSHVQDPTINRDQSTPKDTGINTRDTTSTRNTRDSAK